MSSRIKQLDPKVISKIAAGEVISGPSDLLKELLDNSIDAHAKHIRVDLLSGGLDKLSIFDDGDGMSPEDLQLCYLPHTTSKLKAIDDLNNITTCGFRGEALSSISAVSHLVIKSRLHDSDEGFVVSIEGGTFISASPVGMATGTLVEVSNLFYNVPARKKFLKQGTKEYQKILDILNGYLLAYPEINFSLYNSDKLVFNYLARENFQSRFIDIYGPRSLNDYISFESNNEYLKIVSYISKPFIAKKHSSDQYCFVNKHLVKNEIISKAVKKAYGNLIDTRLYPPFVLFIEISPALIDVNVHPKKETISFWNEDTVASFIVSQVSNALKANDLTKVLGDSSDFQYPAGALPLIFSVLKDSVTSWNISQVEEPVLQVKNTYLCLNSSQGLVLIDQHAAHEKILYEEFCDAFKNLSDHLSFDLNSPVSISITALQKSLLDSNENTFRSLGFDFEDFGNGTLLVRSVPEKLKDYDVKNLFFELLDDIKEDGNLDTSSRVERTLAFLACRGAIKAGQKLTMDQRMNLVKKLSESTDYYSCPHGRPISVIITGSELEKMFHRI